jgi:hypothetical protein
MNIDLLPFSAFAHESCAPAGPAQGNGQTLTLKHALASLKVPLEPMNGIVTANDGFVQAGLHRATVLAADPTALTITF